MNFQSWKFGILDGRKQLHTTGCRVFLLAMAMEIATKEIIFDSLSSGDLRCWIASQCLGHNFPRYIPKQIKMKLERITMVPRFKIPPYICITSKIYLTLREEKKTNLPEIKVWMVKAVRRFIGFLWFCGFVVLFTFYYTF